MEEAPTAGFTGHQDIGDVATVEWVRATIRREVALKAVGRGVTSLARGGDQLFAECLAEMGKPYTVVVPCRLYEETFEGAAAKATYRRLLAQAESRETLPFEEPSETAFYAAGRRVVDCADFMVAVWNGAPAKGLGGTGDVVGYSRSLGKPILHIHNVDRTVTIEDQVAEEISRAP